MCPLATKIARARVRQLRRRFAVVQFRRPQGKRIFVPISARERIRDELFERKLSRGTRERIGIFGRAFIMPVTFCLIKFLSSPNTFQH